MHRKLITLCVAALLILSCSFTAFAQDFDPQKNGSVSVTLTEQHKKEPIIGAELSVYYVATVRMNTDGNLSYVFTDCFSNSGIDIADPSLATKLDIFVSEHTVPSFKVTTDENGTATLRVWVGDNADVAWMEQVVRDFTAEHPDVNYDVQIGVQNEGDAAKVILADVEAAADVFTFADDQLPDLLSAGALMPITEATEEIINRNTAPSITS